MLKKILFPLLSLFLAYRSFELMSALLGQNEWMSMELNILWAFLLNLFVTGVFAFTGFAYPTHKILPDVYYKIQNETLLKNWYKILGVKYFRIGLILAFWGSKKNRKKYFNGTKSGIQNFIYQTKQSEIGHLLAFVVLLMLSIILTIDQQLQLAAFTFIINFIGNFYPIVLQRHHRIRISRLDL